MIGPTIARQFDSGRNIAMGIVLLSLAASIATSHAEPIAVGPVPVKVRVNNIDIPLTAGTKIDIDTERGDLNGKGDITASVSAKALARSVIDISKGLLPYSFPIGSCELTIKNIYEIDIFVQNSDLRIEGAIEASMQNCSVLGMRNADIDFKLALQPDPAAKRLGLKLVKRPNLELPYRWTFAAWGAGADPEQLLESKIRDFAKKFALEVPAPFGSRIAIQGASVNGDRETINFLLRGDAHIDAKNLTGVIVTLPQLQNVNVTFKLPPVN